MGEHFGSYQIERRLGAGGMAEVFRAHKLGPRGFNKPVALKRMLPAYSSSKEVLTMFQGEARLAAHLTHPNITALHDFGAIDGIWYMAMELVDGMDLRSVLTALELHSQPMPTNLVLQIAIDLATALDYAHGLRVDGAPAQIIHRDVTPSNVLISVDGSVKLSDFGIARAITNEHRTRTGIVRGKAPYMAPEQARGLEIDHRVDLFALGVVLYECLALQRPYDGKTELDTLQRICRGQHPPLASLARHAPAALSELVERLISTVEWRPSNAAEVLEALEPMAPPIGARRTLGQLIQSLRETTFDALEARRSTLSIEEAKQPSEPPATRVGSASVTMPFPDIEPAARKSPKQTISIAGMPGVESAGGTLEFSAERTVPQTAIHDPSSSSSVESADYPHDSSRARPASESIPVTVMRSDLTPVLATASLVQPRNPTPPTRLGSHTPIEPPTGPVAPPSYPVWSWLLSLVVLFVLGTAMAALIVRFGLGAEWIAARGGAGAEFIPEASSPQATTESAARSVEPESSPSAPPAAPIDAREGISEDRESSPRDSESSSGDSAPASDTAIVPSIAQIDHSIAQVEQSNDRRREPRLGQEHRVSARSRARRRTAQQESVSTSEQATSIRVAVMPFGEVLIDGHRIGPSPITRDVSPGAHTIVAIHGETRQERSVELAAGTTELVIFRFATPHQ